MRRLLALFALASCLARAQSLKDFEKGVTEFSLPNGMHFIVLERHQAPVVSFHSYVNAGSVDDPAGKTGLAHMFEHMAFKGTETIGSTDYAAEKRAMNEVERVYDLYDAEHKKGAQADAKKLDGLDKELKAAMAKANGYVIPNEYPRIIEENGGVGMNADTAEDSTEYFYNFPRNRLELWFLLESQRFYEPVFREFYKERDVVREERRMRIESSPQGRLIEKLQSTAFTEHPYRNTAAGSAADIENLRVGDAVQFFKKYYVPRNITIGIAGDVDPAECKRLAEKYFAIIPAGPPPPEPRTVEPPQTAPRRIAVESDSQPLVAIGYKRPSEHDKDDPAFDVLSDILGGGRTGLLYQEMVRDKKIALGAGVEPTFPGSKYPNLFLFFLVPNMGHSVEENEKVCYEIIERVKAQPVDDETLRRVKTKIRADLIERLDSNAGMADELASYYGSYGDWRELFRSIQEIEKVSAADVQRVAQEYLTPERRTEVYTSSPQGAAGKPGAGGQQ